MTAGESDFETRCVSVVAGRCSGNATRLNCLSRNRPTMTLQRLKKQELINVKDKGFSGFVRRYGRGYVLSVSDS